MENRSIKALAAIHSKQPWFVLDSKEFLTQMGPQSSDISHFYSFKAAECFKPTVVIPDGCIDILFDCDSSRQNALVCGTRVEAGSVKFTPGHRYFGVRFLPGVRPNYLAVSANELIEHEIDLNDVFKESEALIEQVVDGQNFQQQVSNVSKVLQRVSQPETSNVTRQIIGKICQHQGNIQVQELERLSGYTTRTLQRLFKSEIGLTPKGFSRAIRCQSAVYNINHCDKTIFSDLACDLGFTDQSHFLKEFKKLVNVTPVEYQNQVKQKTYLERIHCFR